MLHNYDRTARNAGKKLERALRKAGVPLDTARQRWLHDAGTGVLYAVSYIYHDTNDEHQKEQGHFPYIPLWLTRFINMIDVVKPLVDGEPHFMDVGCGVGDKLIVANWYLDIAKVSGIEYNAHTFAVAEKIAKPIATDLVHGDAFNHDFSPYNLIYMYHPIHDHSNMRRLFLHVARTMPEGGILAEALTSYMVPDSGDFAEYWPSRKLRPECWLNDPVIGDLFGGSETYRTSGFFRKINGKLEMLKVRGLGY